MNKGELVKKIRTFNESGMWGDDEYSLSLTDVKSVLDEANKEFPKLPKNPNTADRINHSIECLEWVLKWFGGEAEK